MHYEYGIRRKNRTFWIEWCTWQDLICYSVKLYFLSFWFCKSTQISSNINLIRYPAIFMFTFFYERYSPVSDTRLTGILDLSHDTIWAIWLARVSKLHQRHDRMTHNTTLYCLYFVCIFQNKLAYINIFIYKNMYLCSSWFDLIRSWVKI